MITTTGNASLDVLADQIADRVWARLQEKMTRTADAQLISIPQAAKRIGISKTKLHLMMGTGEFPQKAVRRIGSRVLNLVAEMERWITAR